MSDDWDDIVLPGFDQPAKPTPRPLSQREREKLSTPRWERFKAAGVHCDDCIQELRKHKRQSLNMAAWTFNTKVYCNFHKAERESRTDDLL
jgi:hypothetical protein